MISAPVLLIPNNMGHKAEFVVASDASKVDIDGVLLQEDTSGSLRPCLEGSCFSPAVACLSTMSLPVRVSLKQTILRFNLWMAAAAPAAVLYDKMIVLMPSGSCTRPVDIAPSAPR